MAVSKFSSVDEYGFRREEEYESDDFKNITSEYFTVLARRSMRWQLFMNTRNPLVNGRKLKRFIRKGIPLNLRCDVWMRTSGAHQSVEHNSKLYSELLTTQYDAELVEVIKIDIPRTFPDNIHFDLYKNRLFNILIAYAHHNTSVGYCQGLNYIAGLILIVTKDEQCTFWLLKHFVENVAPDYHTRNMKGILRDIEVLTELVKMRYPEVNNKIDELGLPWAVIATKWLVCLFAEVLPVETILRVWDVLFAEGYKIIFRVCLAIVEILKDDILKAEDISELAELFRNLSKDPRIVDCHKFLQSMFTVKITRKQIDFIRRSIEERGSSLR
ncbi:unnamed protein product [Diamesa tonsa]